MAANAQTFWLENLEDANYYNRWVFDQLLPHLGSTVLEIGCGNGNFTELLAQYSDHVLAIDLDKNYVQATKQRLSSCSHVDVRCVDVTQLSEEQTFDSLIMVDVLEHIEHDVDLLRQLRKQLHPDGRFIVKVPALSWLYSPMDEVIGHYRRYQRQTLSSIFVEAGFAPPEIWPFNMAGIPGWWLNGKVLKRATPPVQQVGAFNAVVPVLRAVEAIVPPPIGLSLFAVAQLP